MAAEEVKTADMIVEEKKEAAHTAESKKTVDVAAEVGKTADSVIESEDTKETEKQIKITTEEKNKNTVKTEKAVKVEKAAVNVTEQEDTKKEDIKKEDAKKEDSIKKKSHQDVKKTTVQVKTKSEKESKKIKTIAVLTSGGDAPGMNAAIRGVVRIALASGLHVKGVRRGYSGLLDEEIFDMNAKSVADMIQRGGTILYTARCPEFMTKLGQDKGAAVCKKHKIDGLVVIGGDGSFQGAKQLAARGVNTVCIPGTIDLDIACTEYTIGFDTAVNTAMEAIDKVRDTSTSHERCSIIEVMGRHAGYIALWCGIANGAEDILTTERYDRDESKIIENIITKKRIGKKHHIIINAEGVGDSYGMAKRIEAATGMETRATIIGHIQRGGSPTCKDRVYASAMGARAVDLLLQGRSNRVVAYKHGEFVDFDINEALAMKKDLDQYMFDMAKKLSR